MASVQKRVRGTNFSKEEQLILVDVIKIHRGTIENKASDKISWREKVQIPYHCFNNNQLRTNVFQAEAWQKVEIKYNVQTSVERTLQQTEVRKAAAAQKLQYSGTERGPGKDIKLDAVLLALLELLNEKTVVGMQSKFDSDADDCTAASDNSEDIPLVHRVI